MFCRPTFSVISCVRRQVGQVRHVSRELLECSDFSLTVFRCVCFAPFVGFCRIGKSCNEHLGKRQFDVVDGCVRVIGQFANESCVRRRIEQFAAAYKSLPVYDFLLSTL